MIADRLQYYAAKIRSARAAGNLALRLRRRAYRAVYNPSKDLLDYYFRLNAEDRRTALAPGFQDHRGNGNHQPDGEMLRRIAAAYKLACRESAQAPPRFAVRGLWAEWISINYGDLISALRTENLESLGRLLENFNRERFSTGTGYGYDDCLRYRTPLLGRRSIVAQWCHYRNLLQSVGGLETAYFPLVGNPAGVRRGPNVVPIETLRHAYNAAEIEGLLRGAPNPVVVEIGGGFGGQAFQTLLRTAARKYLVFDIPEVAAVCSYVALAAFPGKRVRLFGEGPVSASDGESFDIGVFPHFTIGGLEARSVDLVFNESSFSEMDGACSRAYLEIVERICRGYFLHSNHDTPIEFRHPGGAVSANCIASDLVPSSAFKRIYKRPRVFGRTEDKLFQHYSFLYQRIA